MMVKLMILKINKHKIEIKTATTFKLRLLGLMGQKEIKYGLLLPNCSAIHTFFMRTNIDIVVINEQNQIIALEKDLKPFRIFHIKKTSNSISILELPAKSINNIKINDYLIFE